MTTTTVPTTSEQKVLDQLRKKILAGELPVGEFLSQRKLAAETDASVISVRGALRQLESDGLIENIPRWGVRIPEETPEVVKDRYRIRELLETYVIECISGQLSDGQKTSMIAQAARLDELADQEDTESALTFARLHHDFHIYLAECCNSPLLVKLLERVMNASMMVLNAKRMREKAGERGATHSELVQIILFEPVEHSVEAMRIHVRNGLASELAAVA